MSSICVMVAPNGARRTKVDHPRLPMTPAEIAETARACRTAGAGAIHLHVRDALGRHSLDPNHYRQAIAALHDTCPDMAIQITTEAAGLYELDAQMALVRNLRPSCISFSFAELMRNGAAFGERSLAWMAEHGIACQFILYDTDQIAEFARFWQADRLSLASPPRLILVAGRYSATLDSDVAEFETLYSSLRDTGLAGASVWMTCAFGRGELACLKRSIELGGHVRVGFENAIVDSDGKPAVDNASRVAQAVDLVEALGHRVASAAESAAVLGEEAF